MNLTKSKLRLVVFVFCVVFFLGGNSPASSQTMTIETIPPEVDEAGRTAGERIDEIVLIFRILAGVVVIGTIGYWWHTRPACQPKIGVSSTAEVDQVISSEETDLG